MADDDLEAEQNSLFPHSAGERLRVAREEKGLTLAAVAAETRISLRHLELIEEGDFVALPGKTYAIGFSRSYAGMVGLDAKEIAQQVREELVAQGGPQDQRNVAHYEPGDPARVPSSLLAWLSVLAVVLLLIGGYFAYRAFVAGPSGSELLEASSAASAAATPEPAPSTPPTAVAAAGQVAFTALEDGVWVKFYDKDGRQLMQKQMAMGENYVVPADAEGPQLWTGRPDALAITIGGRAIPKLSEVDRVMRDVPVTAEALAARPAPEAASGNPGQ